MPVAGQKVTTVRERDARGAICGAISAPQAHPGAHEPHADSGASRSGAQASSARHLAIGSPGDNRAWSKDWNG